MLNPSGLHYLHITFMIFFSQPGLLFTNYVSLTLYQNNINKQNRNKLTDKENRLIVTKWDRVGGVGENGQGIKYKLPVIKTASRMERTM